MERLSSLPYPTILGTFYHGDQNNLFLDMKQAIGQKMSKLNLLYNTDKILFVEKCIINGEIRY